MALSLDFNIVVVIVVDIVVVVVVVTDVVVVLRGPIHSVCMNYSMKMCTVHSELFVHIPIIVRNNRAAPHKHLRAACAISIEIDITQLWHKDVKQRRTRCYTCSAF